MHYKWDGVSLQTTRAPLHKGYVHYKNCLPCTQLMSIVHGRPSMWAKTIRRLLEEDMYTDADWERIEKERKQALRAKHKPAIIE